MKMIASAVFATLLLGSSQPAQAALLAQFVEPRSDVKLKESDQLPVRIRVRGEAPVFWEVVLTPEAGERQILANGSGEVLDEVVAEIDFDDVALGVPHQLELIVDDPSGTRRATVNLLAPNPLYAVIPLLNGDPSLSGYGIYAQDQSGESIVYSIAIADPAPLVILRRSAGQRQVVEVRIGTTAGTKISGNGRRLFYRGALPGTRQGLIYRDLESNTSRYLSSRPSFFTTDSIGDRIAYHDGANYFVFDIPTDRATRITTNGPAVDSSGDCARLTGSTPFMSRDGETVVFISDSTLGIAPEDPAIGCRIFRYDVASGTLAYVVGLPAEWLNAGYPALSGDGSTLTFAIQMPTNSGAYVGSPVLVDLDDGIVHAPLLDLGGYTAFDATVTGDGTGVVLSSQADLDPSVGNADHNLESFFLDLETGDVSQISDTVGGVGINRAGCPSENFSVSDDGAVVVYRSYKFSSETCILEGPQRATSNGMWLGVVRAIRKRPGNRPVVLAPISDVVIAAGNSLNLTLTAMDDDGDPISFYAQTKDSLGLPPGARFHDNYDGTATLEWETSPAVSGNYTIRVAAFDEGGGETYDDIEIIIAPRNEFCAKACDGSRAVQVDDIVTMVSVALGSRDIEECRGGDENQDGAITIEEIITASLAALEGCR